MTKLAFLSFLTLSIILLVGDGRANDESPVAIAELSLLPHQAGICDLIFAGTTIDGTIVSNNEECAADFVVDDVLWGHVNSSNITIRSVSREYTTYGMPFDFAPNERYLVCAFTNNWWANESLDDTYYERLYHYLSVTSSPPEHAVFDGYRTMLPRYTAIPFSRINYNGSNYWTATRSLITNLVDIARVRQDEQLMRHTITNIIGVGQSKSGLPAVIWNQLWMYKSDRYDSADRNPQPIPSPPSP